MCGKGYIMKDKYKKKKKPVSYKVRRSKGYGGGWAIFKNGVETYHVFGNEIEAQYFIRELIKREVKRKKK